MHTVNLKSLVQFLVSEDSKKFPALLRSPAVPPTGDPLAIQ